MFRKRTYDIMNKIKESEESTHKFDLVQNGTDCDTSVVRPIDDGPSSSTSIVTSGFEEEIEGTSNSDFNIETVVPIWTEESVIIENLTGDPEVGLGLELTLLNNLTYEPDNETVLVTNVDLGLNLNDESNVLVNTVNNDEDPDIAGDAQGYRPNLQNSVTDNSDIVVTSDNNITSDRASPTSPSQLTKKGTVRKRKLCLESKEERDTEKKRLLKEKHSVLPPCGNRCILKCTENLSEEQRCNLNQQFWEKSWVDRRAYILTSCERLDTNRKTTGSELVSKRNKTFKYYLLSDEGNKVRVCKTFFLTTFGYNKKNDRFIFEVLSKTPKNQISPISDKRGKKTPGNLIPKDEVIGHILSFQPQVAHYRREHAPNTLYLPSDITITLMHKDFLEKHPNSKCSYDVYRCQVKKMKISFAKLGHEECETCEQFKLHGHKQNNLVDDCQECQSWTKHINAAKESRALYRTQKKISDPSILVVSADLQKIIMLPRVETFKKVLFTKRLVAYHESFVPTGDNPSAKPFAVVWHEAISGRNKEDLISTFYAFLKHNRDFKHIIIWLDNCSSQNKNWCFYTFLVQIINSNEISCESIEVNYFEAGHTFMSADSFHHNVEQSLKKEGKVYDFQDFVLAVKNARGDVDVKEMSVSDFYLWIDLTSQHKLKKDPNRTYMCDIVQVKAKRGKCTLEFKTSFADQEAKELDFLMNKVLKKGVGYFVVPEAMKEPQGFPKEKRDNILKELGGVLPQNRKLFWLNLPVV